MELVKGGETDCGVILSAMTDLINAEPLAKIDYVKMVDAETMQQITTLVCPTFGGSAAIGRTMGAAARRPALCAMAVYIGKTRLIDNFFTEDALNGGAL